MKLTDHFTLAELTVSQTAARRNLDNNPTADEIKRLRALCLNVLEPLRAHFQAPISISSGFRSVKVNKAIGGATSSQHVKGEAADLIVFGLSVEAVFDWIRKSDLPFDQVIQEFGQWVHVSHKAGGPQRRQALRANRNNGRTVYQVV